MTEPQDQLPEQAADSTSMAFSPCTGCFKAAVCMAYQQCLRSTVLPVPGHAGGEGMARLSAPPATPYGWQCPLCRMVHAPFITRCTCQEAKP